MKKYLCISNTGEMEVDALTKIGVSSKHDQSKYIGEFGSGLNYSVALLMRSERSFHVFSGRYKHKFTTISREFRGESVDYIVINGVETSFALSLGEKIWKSWMAIREIVCNAIDEGDFSREIVEVEKDEDLFSDEDITSFYIELTEEIQDMLDNWNRYFSFERNDLLHEYPGVQLFEGGKELIVYRKGIRCYTYKVPSLFHYNIDSLEINESRIVKSSWDMSVKIAQILSSKIPEDLIETILDNVNGTYEENINWDWYSVHMGDTWKKVLNGRKVVEESMKEFYEDETDNTDKTSTDFVSKVIALPSQLVKKVIDAGGEHIAGKVAKCDKTKGFKIKLLDDETEKMLNRCVWYLECELNYIIPQDKISYIESFKDSSLISENFDGTIFVSKRFFDLSIGERLHHLVMQNELIKAEGVSKAISILSKKYLVSELRRKGKGTNFDLQEQINELTNNTNPEVNSPEDDLPF